MGAIAYTAPDDRHLRTVGILQPSVFQVKASGAVSYVGIGRCRDGSDLPAVAHQRHDGHENKGLRDYHSPVQSARCLHICRKICAHFAHGEPSAQKTLDLFHPDNRKLKEEPRGVPQAQGVRFSMGLRRGRIHTAGEGTSGRR